MTLKSYLRMLLAAVTLLFVTTGCNDDDDKVGPPPSYSFSVAVSDVAQTEATITVTPSDDQATYYYAAVKKAEFDTFESDAAYAQHILDNLQAIADKKVLSLSEYLATALVKGSTPQKITDLTAGTDYYAVALGMLTDGRFTSDLVKEAFKTDDAPEPAPELTLSMRAGDASGANTSSYVTCHIKSSDIVSAKAAFLMKSAVDNALAEGKTLADILAGVTNDPTLTAEQVEKINSADGYDLPCRGVPASTAVTAIVSVTSVNGKTTVDSASATTDAAQGGGDLTFTIAVTNIGAKGADINITPSNDSDTYYFYVYPSSVVDQIPDDNQLIAAIISANGGDVTEYLSMGPDGYSKELIEQYIPFDPETEYCVVAFGCNGTAGTTAVTKERFTTLADDGETGDGPNLTITAIPGKEGADTQTYITAMFKVTGEPTAVSGSYILAEKALVDEIVAEKGLTYEQITEVVGNEFTADNLTKLNANGIGWYFKDLIPGTEHLVMAKVKDAAGNSTFKYIIASTDPDGEASDAYKAWLGTWTVTSTSSVYTKKPLTFDVVFKQKVANVSYSVEGWTASIFRDQPDKSPYFPVATFNDGGFYFANGQTFGKFNLGEYGTGTLTYCCFFTLAGKNYYSSQTEFSDGTPFVSLYGTMNSDKQSAVVKGAEVEYSDGDAIMEYADFMYVLDSGQGAMGILPGEGFKYSTPAGEDTDSPIGPYTMVKKGSATSALSAPSKSAVDMNAVPYAGKLSSVLSSRTAVAVTSPEQNGVVFESQVAMPISLVFDRPVALKAVIDNRGNFENAGLKKQISNNLDNNTDCQLLNRL